MKFLAIFAVFLLCVELSQQLPELINCSPDWDIPSSVSDACGSFTCDGPTKISGTGCAQWICAPGKEIGYKQTDNSKPYPECCAGPICET